MSTVRELTSGELFDRYDGQQYMDKMILYQFMKEHKPLAVYPPRDGTTLMYCVQYNDYEPVPAGTIQIGKYIGRGTVHTDDLRQDLWPVSSVFRVFYELLPGQTTFANVGSKDAPTFAIVPHEARFYDIGVIGREITPSVSPEQVAKKYFGISDFSSFFSQGNRSRFSKHNAVKQLSHAVPELGRSFLGETQVALSDRHTKEPSTFQKFRDAHNSNWTSSLAGMTVAGAASVLPLFDAGGPNIPRAAIAGLEAGTIGMLYHGRNVLNEKKETDKKRNTYLPSPSDRRELLHKGSMSTELMRRLSFSPATNQPAMDPSQYRSLISHVHNRGKGSNGGKTKRVNRVKKSKPRKNKSKNRNNK